jgi:hypothetical protein
MSAEKFNLFSILFSETAICVLTVEYKTKIHVHVKKL